MVFVYCAEAMSTHHKPHPASCSPLSSYTQFYVLFMLCKRCPIIVKISKQIVKIDLRRLAIDLESPLTPHHQMCVFILWSFVFAGRVSIGWVWLPYWKYLCISHLSICILCLYLYLHRGSCVCMPMPAAPTRRSS